MKWKVEYTKTFLKELAQLPKEIQSRGEEIAFKELPSESPFEIGYDGIKENSGTGCAGSDGKSKGDFSPAEYSRYGID